MGFTIGKHTEKLLKNAVKMNLFNRFFGKRCFTELKLIFSEENPIPAIRRMYEFDLLKFIHPNLKYDKQTKRNLDEAHRALAWHKLLYLDEPCRQWMVYLFSILAPSSLREMAAFCNRFELPDRTRDFLVKEKDVADKILKELNRGSRLRPSEIYWLLQDRSHESLLYIIALARKKTAKKAVSDYVTHLRHTATYVHGADIKEMGYPTGPIYRTILNHLLEAKLDGQVHNRADEIDYIKRNYPLEKTGSPKKKKGPSRKDKNS
jgi:tRNA nucleotidyltransferase (CCA-adding enzyme)